MAQNWTSVKVSRGRSSSWEKGKTERRIEAHGACVVLDQWDRPAPGDIQAKNQDKGFYCIAKCHPNLSVDKGDTQDQTQEVPAGKGVGLADAPVWKGRASGWSLSPTPPPQLCEPVTPGLLSWLSSPLSFTRVWLPYKWEMTGHCFYPLQSNHPALSREWWTVVSPQRKPTICCCSAQCWMSFWVTMIKPSVYLFIKPLHFN